MIFYSIPFLLLFLSASVLFHFSKRKQWQHMVMLLTSILFYGYWDIRFMLLFLTEIGLVYFAILAYEKTRKQRYIISSAVICLAFLAVFKYCNFFIETFSRVFGITETVTLKLIVPLGISFYTFQMLSYIFDVYRGLLPAETNFIKLAAYMTFFPQITSGPIVKARDFLPQLDILHRIEKENVYRGLQLFLLGLTKKVVFADRIGVAVDAVFRAPQAYNGISILFSILGYAMQIYCDFSGYSDMAIGIASIWDFDLGINFNMPYLAKNPSDFWKRWHISLSSWFQEYVFIPLGGSRAGKIKTHRNLLVTMLLSGLWHGANWTFILWGGIHALGSSAHKIWKDVRREQKKHKPIVSILTNFVFVSLLWGIFRAPDIAKAWTVFRGLFRVTGILYINVYVVVFLALMIIANLLAYTRNNSNAIIPMLNLDKFKNKVLLSVWFFLIVMFAYVGDSAFIYAQF